LLHKRKQLFSLGSNNALLEFLLDGTPQVKEQMHDSRKDVDRQLKLVCEQFIKEATALFVGKILDFIQNVAAQSAGKQPAAGGEIGTTPKLNLMLRQSPWAAPQQISSLIQEAQRNVKSKLAGLQRSMQLYLANKDTEFILFRPIRVSVAPKF
jgi:conserved oligomeric Golgi complex subunit 3